MRTWIFQDAKHVSKVGSKRASWYVGWLEPDNRRRCKSCGPGLAGKAKAAKLARKIDAELVTETYGTNPQKTWAEFRREYEETIMATMANSTARQVRRSLDAFQEATHPAKMLGINAAAINRFRAAEANLVEPATANKHLRHLRAALQVAVELGYLKEVPRVRMLPEPKRDVAYMPPEVLSSIYSSCDVATLPTGHAYAPGDWWRALILFGYIHGWRIGEMLALERAGVDLERRTAFIGGEHTKGRKDTVALLHPLVVEHFKRLPGFCLKFFPWARPLKVLYRELYAIQAAAKLPTRWGFHSLRRGCGTMNAGRLQPGDLQAIMRHSALSTTMKFYVNPVANQERAVASLFVPELRQAE